MEEDRKVYTAKRLPPPRGFAVFNEAIGVSVSVKLDPNGFTADEEEEIGVMVARVIDSWVKMRETKLLNPGVYGITVN